MSALNHKHGKFDQDYDPKRRQRKQKPVTKLPKRRNWKINSNKWTAK